MTLFEIYRKDGFNKIYKILSGEVSIFEKRMETLLFVKYLGKNKTVILKKNKTPITYVDKILNPIYFQAEEHFKKTRYLKKFKGYIFKVGVSESSTRLHYVDTGKEILSDYSDIFEYAKMLKIDPMDYVYRGELDSAQKNEIIDQYVETVSNLAGIFDGKYYNFHPINIQTVPKDMNVIIVSDFMQFFSKNDIAIEFEFTDPYERYAELLNSYIYYYLLFNAKKYEDLRFDNPNYTINSDLIHNQKLKDLFESNQNYIIIYKILLGTFNKNMHPRGLYTENDISNIKDTINKINLRLKGLDFINLINQNN